MGIFLFIVCLLLLIYCFFRDCRWHDGIGDWIWYILMYGVMVSACTFVIAYPLEGLMIVAMLVAFAWG